jgi:hypothetical protein
LAKSHAEGGIDSIDVNAAVDRLYAGSKLDELARGGFGVGAFVNHFHSVVRR